MSKPSPRASNMHDIDLEELKATVDAVDRVAATQNVPSQVFPKGDPKAKASKFGATTEGQGGEVIQLPPSSPPAAAKTTLETKLLRFPADRDLRKWLYDQAQAEDSCTQYVILLALKKKGAPVHPALLRKDGRRER